MTARRFGSIGAAMRWAAVGSVGAIALKLLILVVTSRLLSPAEFGVFSIALAFVMITTVVGQLGIPTNLVVIDEVDQNTTNLAVAVAVASTTAVVLVVILGAVMWRPSFASSYAGILGLVLLASMVQVAVNVLQALMQRRMDFRRMARIDLTATAAGQGLVTIVLALMGFGGTALLLGHIVYLALKCVLIIREEGGLLAAGVSLHRLRELLSSSGAITIAEAANMAAVHVQRPIIAAALGVAQAGLWSRVYQVNVIQLSIVLVPLEQVMLPLLSRIRDDRERLDIVLMASIQAIALLTLPISLLTAAWAPLVIPLAFGPAWSELVPILQIGSLILFFRGLDRILISASRALKSMKSRAAFQVVQLALVVLILVPALPYGLVAASWAYIGALFVNLIVTMAFVGRTGVLRLPQFIAALRPAVILVGLPAAASALAVLTVPTSQGTHAFMLVATVGLAVSYGAAFFARSRLLLPIVASALDALASKVVPLRRFSRGS